MSEKINTMFLSGSGNIFAVIDNRIDSHPSDYFSKNSVLLTSTEHIQTEGIIVINPSENFAFNVWFFNPDGSSGMMCGNGGRCAIYAAIKFGYLTDYQNDTMIAFEMNGREYSGKRNDNIYYVYFPPAMEYPKPIPILENIALIGDYYKKGNFVGYYANVGNDQYVIEVADINAIDVNSLGKFIRYDKTFEPNGTNVNFYNYSLAANVITLRTYERGVERETGACGTGAIATALVHIKKHGYYNSPIKIIPTSQSPIFVDLILQDSDNTDVFSKIQQIVLSGEVSELL